jgi:hypothetical protein
MFGSTVLRLIVACVAGMLIAGMPRALNAQETISTDRPGLAFSPITVPQGALQFEVGVPQIEMADAGSVEATITRIPFVAVRYGVVENLELRAISPLHNRSTVDDGTSETEESGNGDLELGAKWHVMSSGDGRPDISLIGSVFLPVGDDAFTISTEDRVGYALNGVVGGPLGSSGISWVFVGGATVLPSGEDEHVTNANLVGYLGRSLTSRVSGYVDAGWFPSDADTEPAYAGGGLAFLAAPRVQLDAFFDAGLNDDALDWIFGGGVSFRLFR